MDLYETFEQCMKENEDANSIFVDMPIGLPENQEQAENRPEKYVRKLLPKKASSVFNVPCRQSIYESTYEKANKQNKKVIGKGLSKQSFYISRKCKEIDVFLKMYPQFKNKIIESHPELQFSRLTKEKYPIQSSKKTVFGQSKRRMILSKNMKEFFHIELKMTNFFLYETYPDDILDALCLAIGARLSIQYGNKTIPKDPKIDSRGLFMKMTYYDVLSYNIEIGEGI